MGDIFAALQIVGGKDWREKKYGVQTALIDFETLKKTLVWYMPFYQRAAQLIFQFELTL